MKETLDVGEFHPSATSAFKWFQEWKSKDTKRYLIFKEALASTAFSGNRTAEICLSTLKRLENGEPVSDRYLLGLCWFIREDYNN